MGEEGMHPDERKNKKEEGKSKKRVDMKRNSEKREGRERKIEMVWLMSGESREESERGRRKRCGGKKKRKKKV